MSNNQVQKSSNPLVSVMMPTYNVKQYLAAAIDGVIQQTFSDWELIIVDDGSTDGTSEVLNEYANKDKRIKIYYEKHAGRGVARNRCLKLSQGKYIAVCDSDDISFPQRFEKQVEFLENNPEIGAVGAQLCSFQESPIFNKSKIIAWPTDPDKICQEFKRKKMKFPNCAAMIRMSIFKEYGGYSEELIRAQDYEFFSRINYLGVKMQNLPEVLVFYRQSHRIVKFNYYKENMKYHMYSDYITSGGNKSYQEFSQSIIIEIGMIFVVIKYLQYVLLMNIKLIER